MFYLFLVIWCCYYTFTFVTIAMPMGLNGMLPCGLAGIGGAVMLVYTKVKKVYG